MNQKILKILLAAIVIPTVLLTQRTEGREASGYAQTLVIIEPRETGLVPVRLDKWGRGVKLSWPSSEKSGYIVENQMNLSRYWFSYGMDAGTGEVMIREINSLDERAFFRVLESATFHTGDTVNWRIFMPFVLPEIAASCTARWHFHGVGFAEIGRGRILDPIPKKYFSPGPQFVTVTITFPDGSRTSKDWLVMIAKKTSDTPPALQNMVMNQSFEEMDGTARNLPKYWKQGGYGSNERSFLYPAPGVEGSRAAAVSVANRKDGDAKWYFDDVSISAGAYYIYGDTYKSDTTNTITARYTLEDKTFLYTKLEVLPPTQEWKSWETRFLAPTNSVSVTIFHALTSDGTLILDDVILKKDSE